MATFTTIDGVEVKEGDTVWFLRWNGGNALGIGPFEVSGATGKEDVREAYSTQAAAIAIALACMRMNANAAEQRAREAKETLVRFEAMVAGRGDALKETK